MPSLNRDPNMALQDTIRSLKSRVDALENRRSVGRAYGFYEAGNGLTYVSGADRVILWDDYVETPGLMMNPFAGLFSTPYTGAYEFQFTTAKVGTARLCTAKIFRSNTGTTLASRDLQFTATDDFNVWTKTLNLNEGDSVRLTINPSGGNAVFSTDATLVIRQIA